MRRRFALSAVALALAGSLIAWLRPDPFMSLIIAALLLVIGGML